MVNKSFLLIGFILFAVSIHAQKNFVFSPEKPKAGAVIEFSYEPAGDIATSTAPVELVVYSNGSKGLVVLEPVLTKQGRKYSGSIQTDTSHNFLYLGFNVDGIFDNNFNQGYYIQLYDGDQLKKGSNFSTALFYRGNQVSVESNLAKALEFADKEFALYPESKRNYLPAYFQLLDIAKKPDASAIVQKNIEEFVKAGLKTEADYNHLEVLYRAANLKEQEKFINTVKKEKFPNGQWTIVESMNKYFAESDPVKKEKMYDDIMQKINTEGNWKYLQTDIERIKRNLVAVYRPKQDWEGFKKAIAKTGLTTNSLIGLYGNVAYTTYETKDIAYGTELARIAEIETKKEWLQPTIEKPPGLTKKQWDQTRAKTYAYYAKTYAMMLHKLGEYKKGMPFAKQAAYTVNKGQDPAMNDMYALLAEKTLPVKQYQKELEQFVKDSKAGDSVYAVLKRLYIKEKKTEAGFNDYVTALQQEHRLKIIADLRKTMLNETAPSFALLDLEGNKVNLSELKGKIVVLDFWATWCYPCVKSFPAMQKLINKYKDNRDIKIVFIDTWERYAEDKQKKVSEFMAKNKYPFQVLMDDEDKVVAQYKVEGIPTKFVIDKEGIVRFKTTGYYEGDDDKLINELSAMIELATAK